LKLLVLGDKLMPTWSDSCFQCLSSNPLTLRLTATGTYFSKFLISDKNTSTSASNSLYASLVLKYFLDLPKLAFYKATSRSTSDPLSSLHSQVIQRCWFSFQSRVVVQNTLKGSNVRNIPGIS